jgi:glycosyltransferase involved in cell wall biosynthesis
LDLSIVVPAYNEAESLPQLQAEVDAALRGQALHYEVVYIDDGSTDASLEVLRELHGRDPGRVQVLSFRRNHGKSAALAAGFAACRGEFVVTLDADLQDDPAEVPRLLQVLRDGADLVCGWKKQRHDPWSKRWPSKLFNFVTGRVSGVRLHDFNTGLKAYRCEVVRSISVYGELHRFIPVLAAWQGFVVRELPVGHRARRFGRSKFGPSRFLRGFFDLLTVMFLTRSGRSPLYFFGSLALVFFVVGAAIELWFFGLWMQGHGLRVRPLMLLGIGLLIVAIQIASMGLLAEMLSAERAERQTWSFRERLPRSEARLPSEQPRAGV